METLGDLSLHRHLSLRSAWICLFNGSRDPLRHLMLGGHRIWSIFPARPSLTPNFGVEFLKLFLRSPSTPESHGISCHGKNDSTVVYLAGITAPALLLLQTLIAVVALEIFRKVAKLCADWCFCLLYSLCMLLSLLSLLLLLLLLCCCCFTVVVVSCSYCPLGRVFCCDECHLFFPLCRVVSPSM
jgi:hypothetical protein